MKNSDKEEINEKKRQAEKLISKAEDFIAKEKIAAGLKAYQKATNIFFDIGSYMKIPDIFNRISTLLEKESAIYKTMEYLQKIKFRLKNRNLIEEEAKIMMIMGNFSLKLKDYASAAEYFEEAAELFLEAEPEEYRAASSMFLIRAAECYEHMKKHEMGERIIVEAVLRLNPKVTNYLAEENKGIKLMEKGNYKDAIPIYQQLYQFFHESLKKNLSSVIDENSILANIAIFVKTRLIHIISEYRMILMFCYDQIGEKEKSKEWALESIDQLNAAIEMTKDAIIKGIWNRQDLKRLLYIGFMRAYFQKYHHIKNKTPDQQIQHFIIKGITGKPLEIIKKLPYFDLCIKTETYDLQDLNEILSKFNLGRLEKYKKIIIKN